MADEADTHEDAVEDEEEIEAEEEAEEADEETDEDDSEDDAEPPTRKSSSYYVGFRRGLKQAREEKKDEKPEDILTPKAKGAIQKELAPVVESLKRQADEIEVREYFAENPSDKRYEKAIRKRMEAWPNVPVAEIAKTVKFGTDQKERGIAKKEAVDAIRGRSLRGGSARGEDVKLPDASQHKDIYARIKKGEKFNLESGEWGR